MSDPRYMHEFMPRRRDGNCQHTAGLGGSCGQPEYAVVHQRWAAHADYTAQQSEERLVEEFRRIGAKVVEENSCDSHDLLATLEGMASNRTNRTILNQGMNWIRPEKRLAIYLRDGLACAYCGAAVEDGTKLTLDHLRPYKSGGTNLPTNLVTCCHRCNSSRGARSWKLFATGVAVYLNHGVKAAQIVAHIETTRQRKLDITAAKYLIASRGGFTAALRVAKGE